MYIPNNDNQNYPFCRIKSLVKRASLKEPWVPTYRQYNAPTPWKLRFYNISKSNYNTLPVYSMRLTKKTKSLCLWKKNVLQMKICTYQGWLDGLYGTVAAV